MLPETMNEKLVDIARKAIECRFNHKEVDLNDEILENKRGVFVTLTKDGELRGCIGFPEPVYPLGEAVRKAAVGAAFGDPRFPPVEEDELKDVQIEVSVLTLPEEITVADPQDYLDFIRLGKDGLMIEMNGQGGLFLPQVPLEWNWDVNEYLEQLCLKAGLAPGSWALPDAKLYKFESQVFSE
ncbi:TIGR00296 family protein [Candidatus Woesearchaeota archaeon]|nr:TIGR00296 family protein [Candidatus Woesearchaeota archaeon]